MGRTAHVEAALEVDGSGSPGDYILLPFVNQRRWGAHERPDDGGRASFSLPLPNPGPAHVQVLALPSDTDHWMGLTDPDLLLVGRPMPSAGIKSNLLEMGVTWRTISPRAPLDTLFGMQW
jgi:hypothetical protein